MSQVIKKTTLRSFKVDYTMRSGKSRAADGYLKYKIKFFSGYASMSSFYEPVKWNEYFNIHDDIELEVGVNQLYILF